jgi:NADH:ubiquinone oxidoreductase subunit 5 (subunit L)/multisubunit Na+/H+ antiporter MnhA subunit
MEMGLPAWLLTAATVLPLVSFVILVFWGKKMGTPFAGYVGTGFIGLSFICSLVAMMLWIGRPESSKWGLEIGPINSPYAWIPVGVWDGQQHKGYLDVGVYVDSLTIAMFNGRSCSYSFSGNLSACAPTC